MSADSENTMILDQDVVKSLRELTASVQDLCNIISSEHRISHPDKSRVGFKEKDEIVKVLDEQLSEGQPEKIMDWETVELMPVDEIETENKQYTQKYEDFWKDIDESTQSEKEAAVQAYTSAFSRFEEIYKLIGWRVTHNEGAMYDTRVFTESRDLLIESIFGIEAYQMSRFGVIAERSRMLFELSRLPRLLMILVRISVRQLYVISACGEDQKERPFDALTVVRVLALLARTLKGGHDTSLSMEKLLHGCYAHRILDQPGVSDVDTYHKQSDLLYDCITALDFTRRFRELREPLSSLFYMRYKSEPIQMLFERVRTHEQAMVGIEPYPELPLEENTDPMFHPEIFAAKYLQEFGRLKIEWTDNLDEHLKIYANRNCIRVFAHPTFFYNCMDLHQDERDYTEPTYCELSLTYALLFRPTSSSNLQRLRKYVIAGKDQRVTFNGGLLRKFTLPWHIEEAEKSPKELDINPLKSPTKDILSENFYSCSLPPSIQVAFDIANSSRAVKGMVQQLNQHKVTSTSMQKILDLAPNYPEDIKFMILSVMENDFADMESFLRFSYFAPRLRRLKTYLDSRQPSTIRELWYDRRDYRSWCMFWGAGFFGVYVSLLMLVILLVQIAFLC